MLKLVSLFACSLILSSCLSTPGLEEPLLAECTLLGQTAECPSKDGTLVEIPIEELTGFIALSPKDYAKAKNHHDALHTKLNQCLKGDCR